VDIVNGEYAPTTLRTFSGAQTWAKGQIALFRWAHTHWVIADIGGNMDDFDENRWYYTSESSADSPPTSGWIKATAGSDPAPTLSSVHGSSDPCDGGVTITGLVTHLFGEVESDPEPIDFYDGYGSYAECTWQLACSDPSTAPTLTFSQMSTESHFDFVSVSDGDTILLHSSGHSVPSEPLQLNVGGGTMTMHFTSDGSVNDRGFYASFTCEPSSVSSPTPAPPTPAPPDDPCNGGATIVGTENRDILTEIDFPMVGDSYPNSAHCTWTLTCTDPSTIASLSFQSLQSESNFDYVTVSDDDGNILLQKSGSFVSEEQIRPSSSSGDLTLSFTSDSSVSGRGFEASFFCKDPADIPSETFNGCAQSTCDACVQARYSCGFLWGETCYCEFKPETENVNYGTCSEGEWGAGLANPPVEQCLAVYHGMPVRGEVEVAAPAPAPAALKPDEFALTNGAITDGGNGSVHIRADCPSTAIDATMWTGVVDDDVSSSIHEAGLDTIWLLDAKGGTTETDTSVVSIWWTSARAASFDFDEATSTSEVHGEWDGLSEVLSQEQPAAAGTPGGGGGPDRTAFAFSSARFVEKDHTSPGAEVMVTQFVVQYYPAGVDVPGDGSGGSLGTLRTTYSKTEDGKFRLLSKVLSIQLDSMIEQAVPDDAGGSIVPILFGSKADPHLQPVGAPSMYLYRPFDTAMAWGPEIKITREAVMEDFGDGQLVSSKEVVMLQAEDLTGERDTFTAVFDAGVLQLGTQQQLQQGAADQDCIHLLHRPNSCPEGTASRHSVAVLLLCILALVLAVTAAVYCCCRRRTGGNTRCCSCCQRMSMCSGGTMCYSGGAVTRNTSKLRSLSGQNYLEIQKQGGTEPDSAAAGTGATLTKGNEQQPMLGGGGGGGSDDAQSSVQMGTV